VRLEYERLESRREDFRALTLRTRRTLEAIFRSDRSDADKRTAKADAMAAMRAEYAALKAGPWEGFAGYDPWFERANNAAFGVLGAYYEEVPQFESLFRADAENFEQFYAEVRRIAALPQAERHAALGH